MMKPGLYEILTYNKREPIYVETGSKFDLGGRENEVLLHSAFEKWWVELPVEDKKA